MSTTLELYLHGTPACPLTVHSMLALRMLAGYGVTFHTYDITTDPDARERALTLSGVDFWPQVVIDGEYLGGTEVLTELLHTGAPGHRVAVAS